MTRFNLQVTPDQAQALRAMIKAWPALSPRLGNLLAGAEDTRNETPEAVLPVGVTPNADGSYWFEVMSSSSVGLNQWNYKGRVMKSGDTSTYTGLVKTADTTQFDLRNACESVSLGGLTGIASLIAVKTGSIVRGWPEVRNNVRVFVFERPNDINCNASIFAPGDGEGSSFITADITLTAGETIALVDATAGPITVTLPGAGDTDIPGVPFTVKKVDASANAVTVASADDIDGAATYALTAQYKYVTVVSDDTTFFVIGGS